MTSLTPSDVAKILVSPVKGLKLLFLGSGSGSSTDRSKRVVQRVRSNSLEDGYPQHMDDLIMLNPAASEKVPLLQEEGKSKQATTAEQDETQYNTTTLGEESSSKSCMKASCCSSIVSKKYSLFMLLGLLVGLVFNLTLIMGTVSQDLVRFELMGKAKNKRVVFSGLVGLVAGSISTAIVMKHIIKAVMRLLDLLKKSALDFAQLKDAFPEALALDLLVKEGLQHSTAKQVMKDLRLCGDTSTKGSCKTLHVCAGPFAFAFAFGASIPLLPWILNVYALDFALNVLHQVSFMLSLCALCIYVCGTCLEAHLQATPTSLNPFLSGFKHLACAVLAAGIGFCVGYPLHV